MEDDKKPVPTEPEETAPTPESPPAVTPPQQANDDLRSLLNELSSRVEVLSETVTGIVESGNTSTSPDSTPVKKPWTQWGNR